MNAETSDAEFPEKLDDHPAYRAWQRLGLDARRPSSVEYLGGSFQHRIIYRLHGVGFGGAVIAKGSRRPGIKDEHAIYVRVLSRLAVSTPRYYGFVEEEEGLSWLFLQDAGDDVFMTLEATHRAAAARWLVELHTAAADQGLADVLPERGPNYYLGHLRDGRVRMLENLGHPDLTGEDVAMLEAVIELGDSVEASWDGILSFCDGKPQSMAHGDFQPKNIMIQGQGDGVALVVFDWEKAGWGFLAPDLAPNIFHDEEQVDLVLYRELAAGLWPGLTASALRQMAEVGLLFRLLASIDWAGQSLGFPAPEKPLAQLQIYLEELNRLMRRRVWL